MKARTRHIAQLIKLNINQIDPDAQVILYGSRARGTENKQPDWDILIITNSPVTINKERQFR
ncbi:MAG: nucleotidyltransferase domain-containing protein, partial [Bacteroidales bacterium]|nr:nucleotidyltransferase domain-containing protein [Bacteroidales bacterium]